MNRNGNWDKNEVVSGGNNTSENINYSLRKVSKAKSRDQSIALNAFINEDERMTINLLRSSDWKV